MTTRELIAESNRIEDIHRVSDEEVAEFERFMALDSVAMIDLIEFVSVYEPEAFLRKDLGDDVAVGGYRAPPGGPEVIAKLQGLLNWCNSGATPTQLKIYAIHKEYETLHPFIDCNGRSGRMLWYWMMREEPIAQKLGFLHTWYYQSLQNGR